MLWEHWKDGRKTKSLKSEVPGNPNAIKVLTIENEEDLINMLAMSSGQKPNEGCIAATQMVPVHRGLKPGRKYSMMDPGAGCNAADAKKELGAQHVKSVKHKQQFVLADGTEITSNGICGDTALVENEKQLIPFEGPSFECPIISVRKVVKKGNIVKLEDGKIHNEHRDQKKLRSKKHHHGKITTPTVPLRYSP